MQEHEARNVVITLQVKIDIAGKKNSPFSLLSALHLILRHPKRLSMRPSANARMIMTVFLHGCRASLGSKDFGIAIDEIGVGENLQNGLVGEVIDKAAVEQAVTALAAS